MKSKILKKLLDFLEEDIPFGDITSSIIPADKNINACIEARENLKIFGIQYAGLLLDYFGIQHRFLKKDCEWVRKGEKIATLNGNARQILQLERTVLNLLAHLSGITTLTHFFIMKAKAVNPAVEIACTRKTLPGLRFFEKEACLAGGADPHRFSLSDMILIKDNHIKILGGVEQALKEAKRFASFTKKIEIEVENKEDALKAAEMGANIIMLDNMEPHEIREVIALLEKEKVREKVILEASGGINLENIEEYAKTGVDIISVGRITYGAYHCDISMEVEE